MSETVKITGGRKLRGVVTPIANKNALLAVIPAAVLSNETIIYKEVPETSDVVKLLTIIEKMGGKVVRGTRGEVKINCKDLNSYRVDEELGGSFRAALADPAVTVIHGMDTLKRRYPNIIEVYKKLGAKIEIVSVMANKVK